MLLCVPDLYADTLREQIGPAKDAHAAGDLVKTGSLVLLVVDPVPVGAVNERLVDANYC